MTTTLMTDITLPVNAITEIAAMKRWIQPFEAPLYGLALNLTGDTQDAESVLAEVLVRAWAEFGGLTDHRESYRWLVRIAVREALPLMRARRGDISGWLDEPVGPLAEAPGEVVPWAEDTQARYTPQEWQQILFAALASLSPLERAVFLLRDVEKFSAEETANLLSLPLGQVRLRLQRARLLLREKLNRWCRTSRSPEEEQKEIWASYAELCT